MITRWNNSTVIPAMDWPASSTMDGNVADSGLGRNDDDLMA
jgi:hypothetical protein